MKTPQIIAAALAFVAGVLFLIAGPQYAEQCTLHTPPGDNAMSVAFAIPAMAFTFAGCAAVIGSVAGTLLCLTSEKPKSFN